MQHAVINTVFTFGLCLFLFGYLSVGKVVSNQNNILFGRNITEMNKARKEKPRIILFLLDGARPDYLFGEKSFNDWEPFFQELLKANDNHTVCTTMSVDPPSSTTQGVKTLLTGGMPSFIELGQTFYSDRLCSDHFLKQAFRSGLSIHHIGDPVWRELAGDVFNNSINSVDSYDVFIDDSDVIQEKIDDFFRSSYDLLIIHSLLVDHNAHKTSSSSPTTPAIYSSLLQFNAHLSSILRQIKNDTLLFVFGDHGLSSLGNHGGATIDEITTGLCVYSPNRQLKPFDRSIHLRDLTPTLSYLFNIPVPFSNIGLPILSLLDDNKELSYYKDTVQQIRSFLSIQSSKHVDMFEDEEKEIIEYAVSRLQKELNHSHIQWENCIIGLLLSVFTTIISMDIRKLFEESIGYQLLITCFFTSYSMILTPLPYALIILISYLTRLPKIRVHTFIFIILPLFSFHPLIHLFSLCIFIVLSFSTSSLINKSYLVLFALAYFSQSSIICFTFLLLFAYHWWFTFKGTNKLWIYILLVLLIHRDNVIAVLCYYCFLRSLQSSIETPQQSWFLMTAGLYFTFLITPNFSFSSLKWAAAFVFTHKTQFIIQGFSMVLSVYWSIIGISMVWKIQDFVRIVKIFLLAATVSVIYNTASPVIWSVYTPVLLFLFVLWIVLLLC